MPMTRNSLHSVRTLVKISVNIAPTVPIQVLLLISNNSDTNPHPTHPYFIPIEKSSNLVKHVDALLIQAGDLVKQMEVEIRSHDAATRKVLSEKISQYKKSLASLRSDFERARTESQRSNLNLDGKSAADRDRYLATNDKYATPVHPSSSC
jgi:hypothetical protein